ncbi:MAG: histidine phosphatase family protein [Candidatus Saccharimonadaceae bacterium]|nr:histidine phosphatase family protein [Candidatus Saccharimonadaceae bacterium]
MKLEKLVIVRHGDYNYDSLSEEGKKEVEKVAELISEYISNKDVFLFSSAEKKAIQSTEIIKSSLGLDISYDFHNALGPGRNYNEFEVFNLVKEYADKSEVIVFVTHMECAEYFPAFLAREMFNKKCTKTEFVGTGEAVIFDCENIEVIIT